MPLPGAPEPEPAPATSRRAWTYVLVGLLAAGGLAAGAWKLWGAGTGAAQMDSGPTARVTRGQLIVSVTESGEVEAERRKVISNQLQWPVTIKSVVEEGSLVREGETIVVFECKELEDAIARKEIDVTNADNAHTQARESLVLKKREVDNQVRKALQAVKDANSDLLRYIEGEGPTKLGDTEAEIRTAQRDLALARQKLDFKLKVNADKQLKSPFSDNEIEADKLYVERLNLALQKALNARDMLVKYDHPRQVAKLKMAVEDAVLALARARLEAKSQVLQAEADASAKNATLQMQQKSLADLKEQAAKLVVKAEKEGLVVYDTGGNWWRGDQISVDVGAKINSRQQIMIIPDMSTLQIKTKVYESIIDQVTAGLPAHVRLDARPDAAFPARVAKVAVLPDSQNRWLNPGVKVFKVIVKLAEPVEGLKPGMTAQVEVELARLNGVLSVPVAAVFTEQEQTYCYKRLGGSPRRMPVKVGRMNDTRVEIVSGLAEGDEVLLAPPQAAAPAGTPAAGDPAGPSARPRPKGKPPATRPARQRPGRRPRTSGAPADGKRRRRPANVTAKRLGDGRIEVRDASGRTRKTRVPAASGRASDRPRRRRTQP
jgi:RND family efflux transporter MFP subunit